MIFGSTLSITSYPSGIFEHQKLEWIKDARKKSTNMRGSKVSTAFENIIFIKKNCWYNFEKGVIKRSRQAL